MAFFYYTLNPDFSRTRVVQEQGISARRCSVLLRGLNNAAEGVMPKALRRSGSPLVKNIKYLFYFALLQSVIPNLR